MQTFLIAAVGLVLVLLAVRGYLRANPAWLAQNLPRIGGAVALALAVLLVVRGSTSVALPVALLGLWLMSGQAGVPWGGTAGGGPGGRRTSTVKTDTLEMELDLDTGDMRGRITKGFFSGRRIQDLRPVELAHLWQDCRFTDPQSAQLVEAFLDRVHPTWREDLARAEAEAPRGPDGKMTREEALDILGLEAGAGPEDVRRSHRALMLKLHPDRGGSTYLAAKINEAKDVLLAESGPAA